MEIEVKFQVQDAAVFTKLLGLSRLGAYILQPGEQVEQQRNTYYDTRDGRLQAQQYGLRIREAGGLSVATLKGPNLGQGDIFHRNEWEVVTDNPNPLTWPESEARTQALRVLENAQIHQLLSIHTNRWHIIALHHDQEIAELCLDEGTVYAGGATEDFCELEIELLSAGTQADIRALTDALRDYMPIIPEKRNKLQRGLALLQKNQNNAC